MENINKPKLCFYANCDFMSVEVVFYIVINEWQQITAVLNTV